MSDQNRREFLAVGMAAAAALAGRGAERSSPPPGAIRSLERTIRGQVLTPAQRGYVSAAHIYNQRFDALMPWAIARPVDSHDVQAAVRWAVNHGIRVRSRSGGHSYAGYSTLSDGVVIDVGNLKYVHVDSHRGTATIGAGAQLLSIYTALARHGVTIPAGSCPSVGIAGVTLGGGMGLAARSLGLTLDSLTGITIVTADGRLRHVDQQHDPDLFWALRGSGGGNFGIVTSFTFRLHPMPSTAAYFFASWPWSQAVEAITSWLAWLPQADRRIGSILHLNGALGQPTVVVSGQFMGSVTALEPLLAPLRHAGASVFSASEPYLDLQLRWAGCTEIPAADCHTVAPGSGTGLGRAAFDAKSDYLTRPLSDASAAILATAVEARSLRPGSGAIIFDGYGGAIAEVPARATAFVHRNVLSGIQYISYGADYGWLAGTWQQMRPYVSGQAYQNYIDPALRGWQQAYYGSNYARLVAVRRSYDPHHVFNLAPAI